MMYWLSFITTGTMVYVFFLQVLAYMLDRNAALLPAYIAHDEVCGNDIKIVCVSFLKLFMINFDHIWFME